MMCNRSIIEGHLPISQKTAIVTPLTKKEGLDSAVLKNYRPVSDFSFISNLVERVVTQQLNGFLSHTGSLPSHHSAYRQFHSTETALIKVVNDLAITSSHGQVSLLSLLDLSAAFDTVDHDILIKRLENTHGVRGVTLKWFTSYLTDRTQRMVIGEHASILMTLDCGVPHGSVLGPLLFLMYTVDILDIIYQHGLEGHCYADDTQTYVHCSVEDSENIHLRLLPCPDSIDRWMASNRLKLNGDKAEFIWIGLEGKLRRVQPNPLSVSGVSVVPSVVVRNLGVYVDGELSMKDHINKLARTCFFQLRQLRANDPEIINERSHSTSAPCFRGQPIGLLQCAFHRTSVPIPRETAVDSKCCCASLLGSTKIRPCHFHNEECTPLAAYSGANQFQVEYSGVQSSSRGRTSISEGTMHSGGRHLLPIQS